MLAVGSFEWVDGYANTEAGAGAEVWTESDGDGGANYQVSLS
jgi:hypothetical protein